MKESDSLRPALIAAALFLTSLCYIYGFLHHVEGSVYTGIRSLNASDYNVNLSWIEQFRNGHFLLRNLYTQEPQHGFLIRPVYYLLSIPFAKIPLSNTAVLHILRIACGVVLLTALFPLLGQFTEDRRAANLSFVILCFTSGAGIFFRQWVPQSTDLTIPESVLFLALGEAPHFLYSLLFLWLGTTSLYLAAGKRREVVWVYFFCLTILWWEHPFDAVTLSAVAIGTLWLSDSRKQRTLILAGTIVLSVAPYLYYNSLNRLPAFAGWSAQNRMLSPTPAALLSGFFPLLVMAIPGGFFLKHKQDSNRLLFFLVVWIVAQFALTYFPFPFQRRLIGGVQFPLALLAAYGLIRFNKRLLTAAWLLVFASGNLLVTWQQIREINGSQMPFYLPVEYKHAFDWLASRKEKDAVLSGFVTGNFIPGYTGCSVYLGHSALTPDIAERRDQMRQFYSSPDPGFLRQNGIRYVFWGREERSLTNRDLSKMFKTVFEENGVAILTSYKREDPVLTTLRCGSFPDGSCGLHSAYRQSTVSASPQTANQTHRDP